MDGDSHGIRPAEILWNGAHGAMKRLDAITGGRRGDAADDGRAVDERQASESLLRLRHLIAAIIHEFAGDDLDALNYRVGNSYDGFDQGGKRVMVSHLSLEKLL